MSGAAERTPLDLDFSLVAETDHAPRIDEPELEELTAHVLRNEGATGRWGVTVALVDDARLQALHRDFMGSDTPTDIMTFPADEAEGGSRGGELVISVDHARERAGEWGLSPEGEVRFLVAHGLLHLLGWRDDSGDERARMLERQRALLAAWERGDDAEGS
jgi:probable rRNA maturation factor